MRPEFDNEKSIIYIKWMIGHENATRCGPVWLRRVVWDHETAGSNPVTSSNVDRGNHVSGGTLSTPRRPIAAGDSNA